MRKIGTLLALLLIAGCGSGSSSSPGALAPVPPQPPLAPTMASVTVTIAIPQPVSTSGVKRQYVSSSTKSATIAIASGSSQGTPTTVNCTTVCSAQVSAPIGSDTFTINLYDAQNGSGHLLSTGNTVQNIAAGAPNAVNLTFDGVVASLSVSVGTGVIGVSGSVPVTVNALDAAGNIIVGPGRYVDANGAPLTITLSDSDSSGAATLSTTSITQPGTAVTLAYNGNILTNVTVGALATGIPAASATWKPVPSITSFSPSSAAIGTAFTETITGHFDPATTTLNLPSSITATNVQVTATTITAKFAVNPEATVGATSITASIGTGATSAAQSLTLSNTGVIVVTKATDANPGAEAGTCPAGSNSGGTDLRYALCTVTTGGTIVFDTQQMCGNTTPCVVTLNGMLPPIETDVRIDGQSYTRVAIDGNNNRGLFADTGTVVLSGLDVRNMRAQAGDGSEGSGGGFGAGGCLFVNNAAVTVQSVYFEQCSAVGGNGGAGTGTPGGGGGMQYAGGASAIPYGGGGGGLLSSGAAPQGGRGGSGGDGGGGGGAAGGLAGTPFGSNGGGASAAALRRAGGATNKSPGGNGGFGGGGGGGQTNTALGNGGNGGSGGFGGGGGSGATASNGHGGSGGNGGVGGGGGSGAGGTPVVGVGGLGGAVAGSVSGGDGGDGSNPGGGGGAAAGPGIFVNAGTLTIVNSGIDALSTATPGLGSGGGTDGTADATPVFNYAGTVNGSTTTGPLAGVLSNAVPQGVKRRLCTAAKPCR